MRVSAFLFFACLSLTATSAIAQTMQPGSGGAMSGSGMTMPTCKAGDPVVGVSMVTKMYMTKDQMKAKMANMTPEQKQAALQKRKVKMMCKSDAEAMGAKPVSSQ